MWRLHSLLHYSNRNSLSDLKISACSSHILITLEMQTYVDAEINNLSRRFHSRAQPLLVNSSENYLLKVKKTAFALIFLIWLYLSGLGSLVRRGQSAMTTNVTGAISPARIPWKARLVWLLLCIYKYYSWSQLSMLCLSFCFSLSILFPRDRC